MGRDNLVSFSGSGSATSVSTGTWEGDAVRHACKSSGSKALSPSGRTQKIDLFLRQQGLDNDERPPAKALFQ